MGKLKHTLALLLLLASASLPLQAEPVLLDRVVAVVDEEAIMQSELDARMQQITNQIRQQGLQLPPRQVLQQQVMERLILDTIQLQMAERAGIRIDEQTLNGVISNIAAQNGMTLQAFIQAVESDGLTFAQVREQIRQEMLISQVRQRRVGERIQVTAQEVDQYLSSPEALEQDGREFRVAHILIPVTDNPSPEQVAAAQTQVDELLQRVQAGEDFQQLAIAASAGDQAFSGGDLGWRGALSLPSLFADQVVRMREGAVAGPIRSPSGFHLIKLLEVRGGTQHLVSQTQARHILLTPNALRDAAATRRLADELHARLLAGESMESLALEFSDDPGSKQSGGSLGWINPGQTVPAFEQAMNALAIGEISAPVESQFGWHLIQVEARRQADMSDSLRRQQIQQHLAERRFEEEVQNWLREIRESTWVEIRV